MNAANTVGFTPLYLAARNGHLEMAKYPATAGADVNTANTVGTTPLQSIDTEAVLMSLQDLDRLASGDGDLTIYLCKAVTSLQDFVNLTTSLRPQQLDDCWCLLEVSW